MIEIPKKRISVKVIEELIENLIIHNEIDVEELRKREADLHIMLQIEWSLARIGAYRDLIRDMNDYRNRKMED